MRRKGLEHLIEAFEEISRHHSDYDLVIAGDTSQPDYEMELKNITQERGLQKRVFFTGYLDPVDVFALFRKCEFVVLPACYSFSASGPLAVALAFEKPVVVPLLGYFAETLKNSIDALLYDPCQPSSLTKALSQMIVEPELRQKISQEMKKKRKDFRPEDIARQTLEVYADMIGSHR